MMQDQPKKDLSKISVSKLVKIIIIALLVAIPAVAVYFWQSNKIKDLEFIQESQNPSSIVDSPTQEIPKKNVAPAGYKFYENKERGFKFAYPEVWGEVSIETNWTAEKGEYLIGKFSANKNVSFGGRGQDYRTLGRGGTPTDQAAFKKINGNAFWLNPQVSDSNEDQGYVRPVNEGYQFSQAYNSEALLTQNKYDDFIGYAYDSASFNLADNKNVYAITLVIKNPDDNNKTELNKIVMSFELI